MNRLQQVTDYVLLQLSEGRWRPGQRLPSERRLSESLGLSRATVREALVTLKHQRVLYSLPGSGHFVSDLQPTDRLVIETALNEDFSPSHEELREYRFAIEAQCAFLAATRATPEQLKAIERAHRHLKHVHLKDDLKAEGLADARFHLAIAEASGNRILAHSLTSLFALLRENVTLNIRSLAKRPETRLRLMRQHTALFEAIYYQKPDKARSLAQDHMVFVDRILAE
ncbi:FadR/GntR family transcriptional regulator [Reinekea sp.]|uniref:FadR/GntR family transcriptional regulator n=1 Tax=Reinekea sp. TaxID=1970455 RepID=UPI002A7F2CF9|nr:FadR/GntR family transcriptional regulator [Reinekea sp.]